MDKSEKNVYELTQERLRIIFKEFDNVCVSFSGGKDSGLLLNLCMDYVRRNHLDRKISVFHLDYEVQYQVTIDYVDRVYLYLHVSALLASVGREYEGSVGSSEARGLLQP